MDFILSLFWHSGFLTAVVWKRVKKSDQSKCAMLVFWNLNSQLRITILSMWCSCFCTKCNAVKLFFLPGADSCVFRLRGCRGTCERSTTWPRGSCGRSTIWPRGSCRRAAGGCSRSVTTGWRWRETKSDWWRRRERDCCSRYGERIPWVGLPKMSDLFCSSPPFLSSRLQTQSLVISRWRKNSSSTENNRTSDLSTVCSQRSTCWL